MWGLIFLIFILGFLLIPLSVENSFGDNIKTRTSAFPHADLTEQPERNAQQTPHNDKFTWNKGDKHISYTIDKKWDFPKNDLMDGGFTRTWNHTMNDHENQKFNGTMHNWWTGLTLYRLGEIDTVSGTYEMDFFYWIQIFEDDDPADFKMIEPDVDFVNAVDYEIVTAKGIVQKDHYYEVEVSGEFFTKMDFEKFPFEKMYLEVIVEPWINDKSYSSLRDSIQFHAWPYPALAAGTPSPGYEIVGYHVTVEDNPYSEGDTYSRYIATYEIQREFVGSILKFIAPVFLMSGLAMAALVFPSEEFMTKIELNAIFLLGILFFVQVVSEEIPSTGAMTVFDHLVMLSYAIIVVTIAIPALKWKKSVKYIEELKELEDDEIDDKRDTDVRYHKLNDINSQMSLLSIKLLDPNQNKKEISDKIIDLKSRREVILDELTKNTAENYKVIVDKCKNLPKVKKQLEDTYKKYNKIAWIVIGSIAFGYGAYIANIFQS